MIAMCVQEEEMLKTERIDHANQFKHSEKKRYKKFKKEYLKPKPGQLKKRGNRLSKTSRTSQQVAPVQRKKEKIPKDATFVEKVDTVRGTALPL